MSVAVTQRPEASVWRRVWGFAKRALLLELRIYANIGRFIARRPAVPPAATGFSYHKPVLTVLL
ncbi:MAG: hypothetical protein K0S05_911, partial [Agromyces sp.]|nr:hypothetical protein [Agromyces sp.]